MERNCWRIVTGTETKPEDENYKELRDFNSRKNKAYSTIYLNVSKAYRCVIDDIEDPVAAWKRLEEHFRPNSRARVIGLTDDFSSWDDNEFKFHKILQELIAEESRLKQSIRDQHETCAFQSIERSNISKIPRSKSKPSSYKNNVQPTRKNTKVMKYPNITFTAESNLSQGYEKDSWISDTAATSHFCSNKNLLRNFRPVKNTTMSVAVGGVRCDIKGTGTVRMIFQNNDNLGIKVERTNVQSPQQNGVAERYNYTAVDAIKVMLNSSGLSEGFWAEALLCHTYVWDRVYHGNQSLTPFELYSGHKPSVKHLKTFGSTA
ncbi:hypothetical protein AVEN_153267-1 [Araneus ventricosus]|uniref:Retrovirus-related Pol polyprotein from transposon TNT 1-94-like beta-barrel domain-containing protein n=1 Tax=Araneus ventricosus TaxID=182803 RepID=A0A4Y2MC73_ARAVE|nr:hypothetical protein AVEN_153267-1 [Araneus ventricosus]